MTQVLVTESHLEDIADSIRGKNGLSTTYTPGQMAAAIDAIPTATLGTKTITANGSYMASADQLDGYSQVVVAVPDYDTEEW
jgi:hypothetical protein